MMSYIAAVAAFWAIWRLIRFFDLSVRVRRFLFVCLGTLIVAPMLVPTSTITVGTSPNGAVVLDALRTGSSYIGYLILTRQFAFPSLGITGAILAAVAWRGVRGQAGPIALNWIPVAIPTTILCATLVAYGYTHPDWSTPDKLNHAAVERIYGAQLRNVAELLEVSEPEALRKEIARLNEAFGADEAVLGVSLSPPEDYDVDFHYERLRNVRSSSCLRRDGGVDKHRFWRCRWKRDGEFGRRDVLRYRRPYDLENETLEVVLDLDYDAALAVLIE